MRSRRRRTYTSIRSRINDTTGVNRGMTISARRDQTRRQVSTLSAASNPGNRYYRDTRPGTPVFSRRTGRQVGTFAQRAH